MITKTLLANALLGLCVVGVARAQQPAADDRLRDAALRIATLEVRRQLPSATIATIDSLLAFYADSVVYEHPSVGAIVRGKQALRTGMAAYLGSVRAVTEQPPHVIVGPSVVVIETPAGTDPRNPSQPVPVTRRAIRVLEFDARGLVRRILDYPW